jgi:Tfp pilus assembly protein PilX
MIKCISQPTRRFAALRGQGGFTLVIVLGVLLITSLLLVAAFTAANGEIHLTKTDRAEKKAYYAAEAGIENYEYHLTQDGNYLSYCTAPPNENKALNQVNESPLHKAEIPSISEVPTNEQYAIQLLPAESDKLTSDHKCDPSHLVETMVEEQGSATGTFRIESTGYAEGAERTVVATFRNANFVSYVWYTKYETADPYTYPKSELAKYTKCAGFYEERPSYCTINYFGSGESVNGPLHTADHAGICGKVAFGRTGTDRIEFGHKVPGETPEEGYSNEGCGTAEPTFNGTHILPEKTLSIEPPPGDEELEHIVEEKYHYFGKTEIILNETTMTVIEHKGAGETHVPETEEKTTTGVAYPPNGVIYVSGGKSGTCESYSPYGPIPSYTTDTACGNVYVHGKYSNSLTIASENDVIINGNVLTASTPEESPTGVPKTNALLGLIANNFVRVYHPLTGTRPTEYQKCGSATNDNTPTTALPITDLKEPIVYAAILAVKHSVIVDNFDCGKPELGHLNIYGAVAGLFSNGLTGLTNGGTLVNGYTYNANYDNRLQVEEPPHFLNPIQAAWYIQRQTEAPNP